MLDILVCSTTLHKQVSNCQVICDGLKSDHRAVRLDLVITSIKFKEKGSVYCGVIDWRKIINDDECWQLFNENALAATTVNMDYDSFNVAIIQAGQATALTLKDRCEGGYMFSWHEVMPNIEEKNKLVHIS
jgi:hypothetical protein